MDDLTKSENTERDAGKDSGKKKEEYAEESANSKRLDESIKTENTEDRKEIIEEDTSSDNHSIYSHESLYKQGNDQELQETIFKMSPEDLLRYETIRGSNFSKSTIKKFINATIGQAVNPNIVIGVAGLCKVFIGEMVEEAKRYQKERGHEGALLPSHMHEAYRRLYKRTPNMKVHRKAPWG